MVFFKRKNNFRNKDVKSFNCPKCGKSDIHIIGEDLFLCLACNHLFRERKSYDYNYNYKGSVNYNYNHGGSVEFKEQTLTCSVCKKKFSLHSNFYYDCSVCGKTICETCNTYLRDEFGYEKLCKACINRKERKEQDRKKKREALVSLLIILITAPIVIAGLLLFFGAWFNVLG